VQYEQCCRIETVIVPAILGHALRRRRIEVVLSRTPKDVECV
jgi:hypothetical protein